MLEPGIRGRVVRSHGQILVNRANPEEIFQPYMWKSKYTHRMCMTTRGPNLKLKTPHKQLLGSLP
jgi:hypothetical protein